MASGCVPVQEVVESGQDLDEEAVKVFFKQIHS